MQLPPFLLDHWLAAHEFATPSIRYNLASSTGPAWTLDELLAVGSPGVMDALRNSKVSYAPPQGSELLRERIASVYKVDPDWVVVTTGANEALLALYCVLSERGHSVTVPKPVFPTIKTLAGLWGMQASEYSLDRAKRFAQSAELVLQVVTDTTRLAVVNTPHNPTGSVMPRVELEKTARELAALGIPLLVDEVYHPLYHGDANESSVDIPNVIVVSDLSKTLSLPGLRVGWIIDRDAGRRKQLIDARSYFTVSGSPFSETVAAHALDNVRQIFARTEKAARENLRLLDQFMNSHRDTFSWIKPAGGTVAFPWRKDGCDTRPMCKALARAGVLFAPGDCFDAPDHFRIGFGAEEHGFENALSIAHDCLSKM